MNGFVPVSGFDTVLSPTAPDPGLPRPADLLAGLRARGARAERGVERAPIIVAIDNAHLLDQRSSSSFVILA